MAWKIAITKTATKQLEKLDSVMQKRIISFLKEKIEASNNPRQFGKALQGNKHRLWRYRVGDYRLICNIEDKAITVLVLAVGHRKEVYR